MDMVNDIQVRKVTQDVQLFVWFQNKVITEAPPPKLCFQIPDIPDELLKNLKIAVWMASLQDTITWKAFVATHFDRMTSSPYLFANYVAYAFYIVGKTQDACDYFLESLSFVTYLVLHCWQRNCKKFVNVCVDLFCAFFKKEISENFEKRGGWKDLNEYLKNHLMLKVYRCLCHDNYSPFHFFKDFEHTLYPDTAKIYLINRNDEFIDYVYRRDVETDKRAVIFAKSVKDQMFELCQKEFYEILTDFVKTDQQVKKIYKIVHGFPEIKGFSLQKAFEEKTNSSISENNKQRQASFASDPLKVQNMENPKIPNLFKDAPNKFILNKKVQEKQELTTSKKAEVSNLYNNSKDVNAFPGNRCIASGKKKKNTNVLQHAPYNSICDKREQGKQESTFSGKDVLNSHINPEEVDALSQVLHIIPENQKIQKTSEDAPGNLIRDRKVQEKQVPTISKKAKVSNLCNSEDVDSSPGNWSIVTEKKNKALQDAQYNSICDKMKQEKQESTFSSTEASNLLINSEEVYAIPKVLSIILSPENRKILKASEDAANNFIPDKKLQEKQVPTASKKEVSNSYNNYKDVNASPGEWCVVRRRKKKKAFQDAPYNSICDREQEKQAPIATNIEVLNSYKFKDVDTSTKTLHISPENQKIQKALQDTLKKACDKKAQEKQASTTSKSTDVSNSYNNTEEVGTSLTRLHFMPEKKKTNASNNAVCDKTERERHAPPASDKAEISNSYNLEDIVRSPKSLHIMAKKKKRKSKKAFHDASDNSVSYKEEQEKQLSTLSNSKNISNSNSIVSEDVDAPSKIVLNSLKSRKSESAKNLLRDISKDIAKLSSIIQPIFEDNGV